MNKIDLRQKADLSKAPAHFRKLVEQERTVKAAAEKAGIHPNSFSSMLTGKVTITEESNRKVLAALGPPQDETPMDQASQSERQQPALPPLEPWDGKKVSIRMLGKNGKTKTLKNIPEPLAKLIEKNGGSRPRTCQAMGYKSATAINCLLNGEVAFSELYQRKVHAALHGVIPAEKESVAAPDMFSLGLAIVLLNLSQFERIEAIAEILNGKQLFRKATKVGWIVIYRFQNRSNNEKFKKLALRDAQEIVCP